MQPIRIRRAESSGGAEYQREDDEKQRIDKILGILKGKQALEDQVKDWRNNPFEPHLIAQFRRA